MARQSNKRVVLLLDRNYAPIAAISWRRAINKLCSDEKAEVIRMYENAIGEFDPAVVRLIHRVLPTHKIRRGIRLSRRVIFARDNFECQYCGDKSKNLTIDHVVPKSRGGKHTFENCTTACIDCNQAKADMSLREWGRFPKNPPALPIMGIIINPRNIPEEWKDFIN